MFAAQLNGKEYCRKENLGITKVDWGRSFAHSKIPELFNTLQYKKLRGFLRTIPKLTPNFRKNSMMEYGKIHLHLFPSYMNQT